MSALISIDTTIKKKEKEGKYIDTYIHTCIHTYICILELQILIKCKWAYDCKTYL